MWAAAGIAAGGVARLDDQRTGMAMILVDAKGENSIVVDPGANARLSPAHVEAAAAVIASAKLLVAQLETPVAATACAFGIARRAGVPTLLNAAPAPEAVDADLLALTDILIVNEVEGQALTGETEPAAIGAGLLAKVGAVILTLGGEGAVLFRRDAPALVRPAPEIQVIDTTGAGDAFIGAFAARLAQTGDAAQALDWGLSAGALACTTLGAAASFADHRRIADLAGIH